MKTTSFYAIGLFIVLLVLQIDVAWAQSPQGLNYQAVARDPSGNVLANKPIDIKIGIHNFSTSELDYEELHVLDTDEFGLFSLIIGNGESLKGDFTQIDWGSKSYGIAVKIDVGSGMEDLGINILQSVPYTFYADKAGSIDNVFLRDLEDVDLSELAAGHVLTWDGGKWNAQPVVVEDLTFNFEEVKLNTGIGIKGGGIITGEEESELLFEAEIDAPIWNANRMQGRVILDADPNEGDVMKWNGTQWAPQPDEQASEGGSGDIEGITVGTGLKGGGETGEINIEATTDDPLWNASKLQGKGVATVNPSKGQVLKWDGNQWSPQSDEIGSGGGSGDISAVAAGEGLKGGGTAGEVTLEADFDAPIWHAGKIGKQKVADNMTPKTGEVIKYDGSKWISAPDEMGVAGGAGDIEAVKAGTGLKGGGTIGEVTLEADNQAPLWNAVQVRGRDIAEKDPVQGNVLKFDGKQWIPAPDEKGEGGGSSGDIEAVNAGVGLSGGGTAGEVTLNAKNDDAIWNAIKLQSRNVGNQAPNRGDVLKWDGSQWKPDVDNAGAAGSGDIEAVIAGTGLSGGGTNGEVTLNAQNNEPLWNAGKIQGSNVSNKKPDIDQILKWKGSQWEVDADNTGPWSKVGSTVYYQSGSVGINTTKMVGNSSFTMLSDRSSGYGGMQVAMESSASRPDVKPFYGYAVNGSPISWTYYDNLSTEWRVFNGGDRLVVRGSNGHVGIGTLNPLFDLHVNGTAGKPGGGSWSNASDRRLKTNVKEFSLGLDIINNVRPVNFQYNGKLGMPTQQIYVGVIAQELQEIAPFMVSEFVGEDNTAYLNVDPSAFDFILINAVKEQQKMIEELKAEITQQQITIENLEEKIEVTQQLERKIELIEHLILNGNTKEVSVSLNSK